MWYHRPLASASVRRAIPMLLVASLAAGCGGADKPSPAPKPNPARTADELAIRCGLARPVPGEVPGIVPEGLLPPGSFVARARRTGSSARATILLPLGFTDAHRTLSANAEKAGFSVIFSE